MLKTFSYQSDFKIHTHKYNIHICSVLFVKENFSKNPNENSRNDLSTKFRRSEQRYCLNKLS